MNAMKDQLLAIWARLDSRQRYTIVGLGLLTLVMLGVVVRQSLQPDWVLLYGGLQPESAASIVEELHSRKIPYKLMRQGTAIMVERTRLYELRLELADKGLPSSSGIGFEIFDRTSLPGTEFSNQVNMQRALQGELSRSINCIEEVISSRVHIVLGRESLYSDNREASASVILSLRPGAQLAQRQVQGLVNLVAGAVEDLKPQGVIVVDAGGNIISSGGEDGLGRSRMTTAQLETTHEFEENLRGDLQSMLDAVIGPHKAIVRVQVELDFDTEQVQSEKYSEPAGGNSGLTSAHIVEETYDGSGKPGALGGGLSANMVGGVGSGEASGGGKYVSREETRKYELSREVVEKTTAAGKLQRLTVAAIVDEDTSSAVVGKVRDILEAASGYDESRGDKLVIETMAIAATKIAEEAGKEAEAAAAAQRHQQQIGMIASYGSGLAAFIVLAAAIFLGSRQVRNAMASVAMPAETSQDSVTAGVPQLANLPVQPGTAGTDSHNAANIPDVDSVDTADILDAARATQLSNEELTQIVRKMAAERPEAVVKQLERLLTGGE
jgi:flagellar M-ring protein FliF